MEEMQNQDAPKMSSVEEPQEEQELSHTDKLVGLFAEPQNVFAKIAKFPSKTIDWFLPVLVLIVVIILGQFVLRTNPEIRQQQKQKGMEQMQKYMDDAVKKGQITREQANEQMNQAEERMDSSGAIQMIGMVVGTPIIFFIIFFVVSGFFYLVAKFGLKGAATFKDVMVAYGLPTYISAIGYIVMIIVAFVMNKLLVGLSVADFMGTDKSTLAGFFLGKIDPFTIWFYVIFGIALAKLNKSDDAKKYLIAVFACWVGVSLIFHFVVKAVPFLSAFAG
jgi:hypothetical protein